MPLPLILGGAAAAAAIAGAGSAVHGGVKMKKAHDEIKSAQQRHEENIRRLEEQNKMAMEAMDSLGKKELEVLNSFQKFSSLIERIQNRPEFQAYRKDDVEIPEYDAEDLKTASVGAGVLLGGLGGAALGTAGGFAAAGATTSAVMALGTASTGTAIASLSGAAATNATLAALGGGAVAAGGGGVALGTTILGMTTLGAGILIGGIIFNLVGGKISDKADKAKEQMEQAEQEINRIRLYLVELAQAATKFEAVLNNTNRVYRRHLERLGDLVLLSGKTDWNLFTDAEKTMTENTVRLVSLLYQMCKVQLVLQVKQEDGMNQVNHKEIEKASGNAEKFLEETGLAALA